jgi:hypothetical protein
VCKSGTVLEVIVVTTCKQLINPISNPNPLSVTNTCDSTNNYKLLHILLLTEAVKIAFINVFHSKYGHFLLRALLCTLPW